VNLRADGKGVTCGFGKKLNRFAACKVGLTGFKLSQKGRRTVLSGVCLGSSSGRSLTLGRRKKRLRKRKAPEVR